MVLKNDDLRYTDLLLKESIGMVAGSCLDASRILGVETTIPDKSWRFVW